MNACKAAAGLRALSPSVAAALAPVCTAPGRLVTVPQAGTLWKQACNALWARGSSGAHQWRPLAHAAANPRLATALPFAARGVSSASSLGGRASMASTLQRALVGTVSNTSLTLTATRLQTTLRSGERLQARVPGGARAYSSWNVTRYNWNRGLGDMDMLYGLIAANVVVYAGWQVISPYFMHANFCLHTIVTSAFSHRDLAHLGTNMLALYFFGQGITQMLGGRYVLQLYLIGGIASSVSQIAYDWYQQRSGYSYGRGGLISAFDTRYRSILGASGAVNALVLLDILLFPNKTILLYFIVPMPAAIFGGLFLLRDILGAYNGGSKVAHMGHLGGASMGALAWLSLRKFGRRGFF